MNVGMEKKKTTRTVKLGNHAPDTCPMIVGKVKKSIPRMRTVKSKEKIKVYTSKNSSITENGTNTNETSGNIMKLCVNLMPVLALAKEPLEEEEEREEDTSCSAEKEPENSNRKNPSVIKIVEKTPNTSESFTGLTLEKAAETKHLSPVFVLPPLTQAKPAPELCDHHRINRCLTLLPPISLSEQSTTFPPNVTTKSCREDGPVTGPVTRPVTDSRPWMDNLLFSKSKSSEFRLPDISLSSLDVLLQTVTQKLRGKRRGWDEEPWNVPSNQNLTAVSGRLLREKSAATETSVGGHSVNRQMTLPPLFPAQKPTIILSMTKNSLLPSNTLQ
uniref:uncharacterized protein LOC109966847 isoform X1 n=1 Tax=Monopterus albus TaxID=43700 RepID=UPI0009B338B1|nr:uncharacterized protein LOC109966847 isoform X1 [Monopterus albus]